MALAAVAHVGGAGLLQAVVRDGQADHRLGLGAHFGEQGVDLLLVELVQAQQAGAHHLVGDRGFQEAVRGADAGIGRDHHAGHAQLAGQAGGVQGRRAAEGDQRAGAGVLAVLHRVHAGGAGHVFIDDLRDAAGGLGQRHVQRCADRGGDGAFGAGGVQRDLAAGEAGRVDAAQRHVGVGHGGRGAAAGVAGGAGVGAGTVRAHHDALQRIDAGDGAAAGTDLHHVDHRDAHREAAALGEAIGAGDLEMARLLRGVVVDQRDLGGGAAHVEGDGAVVAAARGNVAGQDGAAGRAAFHQAHREAAGGLHRADAARRHHQQQRAVGAQVAQALLHARQVAVHQRQDVGVGDGGGGSLVFADFAADLGGDGDLQVGQRALQAGAGAFLMRRVDVGMQEADRGGFDVLALEHRHQRVQRGFVKLQQGGAVGGQAFRDFQAQVALHQRGGAVHVEVVLLEAVLVGDFQ